MVPATWPVPVKRPVIQAPGTESRSRISARSTPSSCAVASMGTLACQLHLARGLERAATEGEREPVHDHLVAGQPGLGAPRPELDAAGPEVGEVDGGAQLRRGRAPLHPGLHLELRIPAAGRLAGQRHQPGQRALDAGGQVEHRVAQRLDLPADAQLDAVDGRLGAGQRRLREVERHLPVDGRALHPPGPSRRRHPRLGGAGGDLEPARRGAEAPARPEGAPGLDLQPVDRDAAAAVERQLHRAVGELEPLDVDAAELAGRAGARRGRRRGDGGHHPRSHQPQARPARGGLPAPGSGPAAPPRPRR